MVSSTESKGFFSSTGVLETGSPTTTPTSTEKEVENSVATETAAAISEAVVFSISQRMNVGNTGFDSGVNDFVQGAVLSALNKRGSSESDSSGTQLLTVAGTYQNEIMYGKKATPSNSTPAPPADTVETSGSETESESAERSQGRGRAPGRDYNNGKGEEARSNRDFRAAERWNNSSAFLMDILRGLPKFDRKF